MREEHQASIGAQIALLREQQGWSQRALAKWVGIDQSAVSRIEAGHRRLSAAELQRFADVLHVSADGLLKGVADTVPAAVHPAAPPPGPPEGRRSAARTGAPPEDFEDLSPGPPLPAARMSNDLAAGPEAWGSAGAPPEMADRVALRTVSPMLAGVPELMVERGDDNPAAVPSTTSSAPVRRTLPQPHDLPEVAVNVASDWFALRAMAGASDPGQRWSTGHSAEGKPERVVHAAAAPRPAAPTGDVLYDRIARFWRSELHVDPDDGPLPDLVPLLEDGYGAQIIVARAPEPGDGPMNGTADAPAEYGRPATDSPVAAAFSAHSVPFIFVNAARPVILQRFALAHAFAHHVLGHGEVVDRRIEWSRNVPPEAAANDFAEEFLAPVRAVQRWYERRAAPRSLSLEDLLDLGNAFGISAWAALYRSRAAGRLQGKQFHVLKSQLQRHEWELLPRQAFLGGLRDTLASLTPAESLPPGAYGGPAVLRVPAAMRAWALAALRGGRLSLEDAAALLRIDAAVLEELLARLGLE
jgi:transcriptional regulator with XRE-family HTH domain